MKGLELGLIGNGAISALINHRGDLVWLCNPRFDADPVFCSLLRGDPEAPQPDGSFSVELENLERTEQVYARNTAILRTELRDHNGGALEIIDFCPRFEHYGRNFHPATVVRLLRPIAGDPRVRIRLRPMRDYGNDLCERTHGTNHVRYVGSPGGVLRLTTNAPVTAIMEEQAFILDRETALVLTVDESLRESPLEVARRFLRETDDYWRTWVRYLAIPFEWQEAVIRAAITLKLSIFEDTGAIIAAPTTSVPEAADSGRNWDYRLCWLRDSYFVVRALNRLSATKAMEEFLRYIINIVAGMRHDTLQPVYAINGEARLDEREIGSLVGFEGMGPVRVGNQAYQQIQHDVYGAVILALSQLMFDERIPHVNARALLPRLERVGEQAIAQFGQPDAGIWELRGASRPHTYSSLMCWAACDRLARISAHLGKRRRADYWRRHARRLHRELAEQAWNDKRSSFVATFGGDALDASLLLMFELGFLPPDDPRMLGTLAAIEGELLCNGLVYRYVEADDFGHPQNAFLVCTFWLVDALAMVGRRDEARELYQRLLDCRNGLGLLAEHLDPATGRMWGNYPQTYSMVGIINSAQRLSKRWEDAF